LIHRQKATAAKPPDATRICEHLNCLSWEQPTLRYNRACSTLLADCRWIFDSLKFVSGEALPQTNGRSFPSAVRQRARNPQARRREYAFCKKCDADAPSLSRQAQRENAQGAHVRHWLAHADRSGRKHQETEKSSERGKLEWNDAGIAGGDLYRYDYPIYLYKLPHIKNYSYIFGFLMLQAVNGIGGRGIGSAQ
jgi:hypothetical protein